jgi:hypothetical protein
MVTQFLPLSIKHENPTMAQLLEYQGEDRAILTTNPKVLPQCLGEAAER